MLNVTRRIKSTQWRKWKEYSFYYFSWSPLHSLSPFCKSHQVSSSSSQDLTICYLPHHHHNVLPLFLLHSHAALYSINPSSNDQNWSQESGTTFLHRFPISIITLLLLFFNSASRFLTNHKWHDEQSLILPSVNVFVHSPFSFFYLTHEFAEGCFRRFESHLLVSICTKDTRFCWTLFRSITNGTDTHTTDHHGW